MGLQRGEDFQARLMEYVEDQLDALVQSAGQKGTRLAWAERFPLTWLISVLWGPSTGEYDLVAVPATGFLVTHSNRREGTLGLHHFLTNATIIPFDIVATPLLSEPHPFLASLRMPLANLVAHVMERHPPNIESPT